MRGFIVFLLFPIVVNAQDSTAVKPKTNFTIQLQAGAKVLTDAGEFNDSLIPYAISPYKSSQFLITGSLGLSRYRFNSYLEFGVSAGGNRAEAGAFQISTTQIDIGISAGYDIIIQAPMFFLEPTLKLGVTFNQLSARSTDSTLTTTNFFQGSTNLFYVQSDPQFYIEPGFAAGLPISKKTPLFATLRCSYQIGVSDYAYPVQGFPLKQLDGINVRAGLRYYFMRD